MQNRKNCFILSKACETETHEQSIVGYRQTVRHWTLTPAFLGSNPSSPVKVVKLNDSVFTTFSLYEKVLVTQQKAGENCKLISER